MANPEDKPEAGAGDPLFQTIPQPLEFERVSRPRPPRRFAWLKWMSLGILAGVVVFGGWWAYKAFTAASATEEAKAPIVHALPDPIKVRPDNPGGLEVPNQDKLIYERLGEKDAPASVERLLPQPEQPLPRPQAPPPVLVSPPPTPMAVPPPDSSKPMALSPPAPPPIPAQEPPRVEAAPPPAKPAPAPAPSKSASGKGVQVQLGAVRSEAEAQKEWNRLRAKHAEQLGKLELTVEKADLGAKGIFYRLRAGPVADEAAAAQMCAQLTQQKVACLVVK